VKHGFIFAGEQIRAVAGSQAEAQNAKPTAKQRRLVAMELHADRCVPRNGVQTAAYVGDGFLLHHETPEYCVAPQNAASQQTVPVIRNFLSALCRLVEIIFARMIGVRDSFITGGRIVQLAIGIRRASLSINDRPTNLFAGQLPPYFAASFALAMISAGVA
jgi:hypothetical protein